jgi:RNA polymerase sigma-70 factor (ECF subfamily)
MNPTAKTASLPLADSAVSSAPTLAAPTDEELVKLARDGNAEAYDALFERYKERVYRAVYHLTANREDANDLVQEAFIKAYRSLRGFKGNSSFYTWIYRIAINSALNFTKQRESHPKLSLDVMDEEAQDSEVFRRFKRQRTAPEELSLGELQERLNKAMQKLSESHRAVVVLHDIEGLSHEEIAKIMKCSEGTVRSRLYYAHQQLQGLLSEFVGGQTP